MFQFPGLPSHRLCIYLWILKHYLKCVPAFGNLRIIGYLLLPAAYRSLSRPSSAPGAKASALCSLLLDLLLVFSLQPSLSHSFQDKLFSNTHTSVYVWDFITTVLLVVKIFWFSRLINEIVFWDLSQNPQNFEKTLLWFISISFSLLTCLYTIWYFIQFSRYILFGSYQSNGGLGRTRTSDLTLIRRAL